MSTFWWRTRRVPLQRQLLLQTCSSRRHTGATFKTAKARKCRWGTGKGAERQPVGLPGGRRIAPRNSLTVGGRLGNHELPGAVRNPGRQLPARLAGVPQQWRQWLRLWLARSVVCVLLLIWYMGCSFYARVRVVNPFPLYSWVVVWSERKFLTRTDSLCLKNVTWVKWWPPAALTRFCAWHSVLWKLPGSDEISHKTADLFFFSEHFDLWTPLLM